MKKILAIVLCLTAVGATGFSDDFSFVLETTESHPEYLLDVIPTFAELGVKYSGLQVIEKNLTELYLLGGGGFGHTEIWTDLDGMPLVIPPGDYESELLTDQRTYNSWHATWRLRFQQYLTPMLILPFGDLSVFTEYSGYWMTPRENGSESIGLAGSLSAYPDQNGVLTHRAIFGVMWADLEDDASPVGFESEVKVHFAPDFLGNQTIGRTNYTLLSAYVIGYLPLYTSDQASGLNLLSVYLANRLCGDAVWGDAVPQRVQEPLSLGTKVRGFEENEYGTEYTLVNNLELRVAGPEILLKNLYPRFHVFVDAGVYGGSYLNTTYQSAGFLASTGAELAVTLLNIFSVGYRVSFVLAGDNMEGSDFVGEFMFSIQF